MSFMVREAHTCTAIDERALQAWKEDGVLKVSGLAPEAWIAYGRQRICEVLGAEPEDPNAWANLKSDVLKSLGKDNRCVFIDAEPIKLAVDDLIGKGWVRPNSGGSWFSNPPTHSETHQIPESELVPRGHWHWDGRPDLHGSGLWVFTLLTNLLPNLGGTWMVGGSGQMVSEFYDQLPPEKHGTPTKTVKKWFAEAHAWFKMINSNSVLSQADHQNDPIGVLNVSGVPGDVVFMRSLTIHSAPVFIGPGPRVCHVITASLPD